jgi:hypothetical protein
MDIASGVFGGLPLLLRGLAVGKPFSYFHCHPTPFVGEQMPDAATASTGEQTQFAVTDLAPQMR